MRERLGQLDALSHPFAVCADLLVGGIRQIDDFGRASRGLARFCILDAIEADECDDPLESGHALVKGVLLRTEPDAEIQAGIPPDGLAEHRDRPFARRQLPGNQFHEGGLAGAVGTEQPGNSSWQLQRHIIEADDLPVPLRQVLGDDDAHATTSTPRTRFSRIRADTRMSTATATHDAATDSCTLVGELKMASPIRLRATAGAIKPKRESRVIA